MKNSSLILVFVSAGLVVPLTIINRQYVKDKYGSTNGYYRNTARNIDIWANVEFRATWNARLRTADGYEFGVVGETISSALGQNQIDGTLTKEGWKLVRLLEKIEKNHCIKAREDYLKNKENA